MLEAVGTGKTAMTPRPTLALSLAIVAASAAAAGAQILPPDSQACIGPFAAHRQEVEKLAAAVIAGSQKRVSREDLCKLVSAYAAAEANWLQYAEANVMTCAIPKSTVDEIKRGHAGTSQVREKICEGEDSGMVRDSGTIRQLARNTNVWPGE
jgi:hypothetical protein